MTRTEEFCVPQVGRRPTEGEVNNSLRFCPHLVCNLPPPPACPATSAAKLLRRTRSEHDDAKAEERASGTGAQQAIPRRQAVDREAKANRPSRKGL